jgi:hypothetical protein
MAVAQHNIDDWFGPKHDSLCPPEHRERFQAIRLALRTAALDIIKFTNSNADQTTAIKHLRYSMSFVLYCFSK